MSDARNSTASDRTWLTKRMMDRVLGGVVQVVVLFAVFVHDLQGRVLVQRVNGVRADAEMFFHLALDGLARGEDRLDLQAGQGLEGVQPVRGEQAAGGDLHRAVDPLERQQLLLEQDAGREQ